MPPLETGALGDVIYHKIAECLSYNTDTHNDYYYITPSQDGGEEEAVKLKVN